MQEVVHPALGAGHGMVHRRDHDGGNGVRYFLKAVEVHGHHDGYYDDGTDPVNGAAVADNHEEVRHDNCPLVLLDDNPLAEAGDHGGTLEVAAVPWYNNLQITR